MNKYTNEEYHDLILRAYEYMFGAVNIITDYKIETITKADVTVINKFIEYVKAEYPDVGYHVYFILNFVESTFDYYVKELTKNKQRYKLGSMGLRPNFIFSEASIKRFSYFTHKYGDMTRFKRFVRTRIKADLYDKFVEHSTYDIVPIKLEYNDLNEAEERYKKLYYNEEASLLHCVDGTFLYNHVSTLCVFCNHKDDCKKLLKKLYPTIYKNRGYE